MESPTDQKLLGEIEEAGGREMTFLQHLEELRWHIIRAFGSVFVFGLIALFNIGWIYSHIIVAPAKPEFWTYRMLCRLGDYLGKPGMCVDKLDFKIQSLEFGSQFTMGITSAMVIGLVFAFPYAFWELWRFIMPGLKSNEKKAARGGVFYVSLLFFIGVLFGYYLVTPLTINFLGNYKLDESISNEFSISSYIGTVINLTLACGVTFQLPVVAYVLSKIGIVTPKLMRQYRKHALVVILLLSAIITPSPDVYSQLLVSFPLVFLYEIGIWISARVERANKRAAMAMIQRSQELD